MNNKKMDIKNLIGKRFKRDKYGLSLWEDTIKEVFFNNRVILNKNESSKYKIKGFKPEIRIKGHKTINDFNLDEIILIP